MNIVFAHKAFGHLGIAACCCLSMKMPLYMDDLSCFAILSTKSQLCVDDFSDFAALSMRMSLRMDG